jgi:hypothetical protein
MQKQLSPGLNARQMKALQANAPSVDDILGNPEFLDELNEEIEGTYEQREVTESTATQIARFKEPPQEAPKERQPFRRSSGDHAPRIPQPDLVPEKKTMPVERPVRKLPEPSLKALDPEAELDEMNRQAEARIAKRREKEEAEAREATPAPQEVSPEEALHQQILAALNSHQTAPSEAQIAKWKAQYGDNGIYVLALNEDDVYVFTYLRRAQWQKIQQAVANAQKAELTQNADDTLKEKVLQFTVLWPRPLTVEFFANSRAGTIDTLFNVIMANSSFLQLSQAMILTTQL